jgi:hypothetical protein
MKPRTIGLPRRRFRQLVGGQRVTFDMIGVGSAMKLVFAVVEGRRIAALRLNRRWERWLGLTGRHSALLRELNRRGHPPLSPRR